MQENHRSYLKFVLMLLASLVTFALLVIVVILLVDDIKGGALRDEAETGYGILAVLAFFGPMFIGSLLINIKLYSLWEKSGANSLYKR